MSDCSNFGAQFGKLFTKVLTRGMAALQSEELLGRDLINDCTMLAADLVRTNQSSNSVPLGRDSRSALSRTAGSDPPRDPRPSRALARPFFG